MKSELIEKWHCFKSTLPHTNPPFSARNWGTGLHSLCSYQGKLKPALAHHLVKALSNEGDVVYDPFSGSGTIPLEAVLQGRHALAADLGKMAYAITLAKVGATSLKTCYELIDDLERFMAAVTLTDDDFQKAALVKFNGSIDNYFEAKTFEEILKSRKFFLQREIVGDANLSFVFSSMLHILHGNRPYALSRRSHPLTPYAPTGEFEYKSVIEKLKAKVVLSHGHKDKILIKGDHEVVIEDVLASDTKLKRKADLVLTSPPFANSTRFYMTNWMRYWFCGWEIEDFTSQAAEFIESKQKKNLDIYRDIMERLTSRITKDGLVVLHLGNNGKTNMGESISQMDYDGFTLVDFFDENVAEAEKHGVKDKGSTKSHQYVIFSRI